MKNPYRDQEELTQRATPTKNLFGEYSLMPKKGIVLSERAELLKYFIEHAVDRKGPLAPARMGFMLSHLAKDDLFYMKSVLESEPGRPWPQDAGPRPSTSERWNRIFWGMLKKR